MSILWKSEGPVSDFSIPMGRRSRRAEESPVNPSIHDTFPRLDHDDAVEMLPRFKQTFDPLNKICLLT
jgi:hypothetical protein